MPRKIHLPQNRFCVNSRLPEPVFLVMLRGFCYGRSASNVAQVTSDWAEQNGYKKVSRETVSKYFILLGEHLFYSYEDAHHFDDAFLDELWELIYDDPDLDVKDREILSREGILAYVNTLQKLSKINHGLSRKNMRSHFGHAIFLTVAFQEYGDNCTQYFYQSMIAHLEKNPLHLSK
jgi:hypothetical protein